MTTLEMPDRHLTTAETGCVAHMSAGGWGHYHRESCPQAPRRGDLGVRDVVHGPWRYLSAHWTPCPVCRPPAASERFGTAA
jgi:hypothetical protein